MERISLEQEQLDRMSEHKREADLRDTGKRRVCVEIAGREYRIRSDADEAWLQRVASHVDDAMRRIREHTGTVDSLDTAVLTALNLAREILDLREANAATGGADPQRLTELIQRVELELDQDDAAS